MDGGRREGGRGSVVGAAEGKWYICRCWLKEAALRFSGGRAGVDGAE